MPYKKITYYCGEIIEVEKNTQADMEHPVKRDRRNESQQRKRSQSKMNG